MTPSEEVLAMTSPALLLAIHVHVGGDRAMAGAVAEMLGADGMMVAEVARRYGVGRKSLERRLKELRVLCLSYCAQTGVDPRTAMGMEKEQGAAEGEEVKA